MTPSGERPDGTEEPERGHPREPRSGTAERREALTVPNGIAALRLAASPGLVLLASVDRGSLVAALFLVLTFTDWLDGKLAVLLGQRTALGARLDTVADVAMYGSLLLAAAWVEGAVLLGEWPWIAAAGVSYGLSVAASLLAFGALPTYHTRAAKTSWFLMIVAVVGLFWGGLLWPLRLTASVVVLANLEATLITRLLDEPRSDVPSVLHAMRDRDATETEDRGG